MNIKNWRAKQLLAGLALLIPLFTVCGLTPAVSYLNGLPLFSNTFTTDDGIMFQVWWRDFISTDWAGVFFNFGKVALVLVIIAAALVGMGLIIESLSSDEPPTQTDHAETDQEHSEL